MYGSWNRHDDAYGGSPRFGSAYLRLRPSAGARATFCWPDSVYEPQAIGGPEKLEELCRLADAGRLDPDLLPETAAELPLDDPLNDYIEAQLHGGLDLRHDVEAVVVDPSDLDEHAASLSALGSVGIRVESHAGYRVVAEGIAEDYRGEVPVRLARYLGGEVTPARLAAAARGGDHDPQAVKWLWHCLARFGRA